MYNNKKAAAKWTVHFATAPFFLNIAVEFLFVNRRYQPIPAYRLGLTDPKMIVQMPEGTMEVEIREDGENFLTGDVGYVGSISLGSYFTEQLKLV